jgi:hypothetical protein
MGNESKFIRTANDDIKYKTGSWDYSKKLLQKYGFPNKGPNQYKLVKWLKDNNDESAFVNKNVPIIELFIKNGVTITVPKDECSVACILGGMIQGRNHLHNETVLISSPRDDLHDLRWESKESNGTYSLTTECKPPVQAVYLSATCKPNVQDGEHIILRIYKKGIEPDGTNHSKEFEIEKKPNEPVVRIADPGWQYEDYTDAKYGTTREKYFFEAFTYCGNCVRSNELEVKWAYLKDSDINYLETVNISGQPLGLQNLGTHKKRLSDYINTHNLAVIIKTNIREFTSDTNPNAVNIGIKNFIDSRTVNDIQGILDSITVYIGLQKADVDKLFDQVGAANSFQDGLTIDKNMYFKQSFVSATDNRSTIGSDTADLFAHEAIHALQVVAWNEKRPDNAAGHFITFCANRAYTEDANPFEFDAYKFGGARSQNFPNIVGNYSQSLAKNYRPSGWQGPGQYKWWR